VVSACSAWPTLSSEAAPCSVLQPLEKAAMGAASIRSAPSFVNLRRCVRPIIVEFVVVIVFSLSGGSEPKAIEPVTGRKMNRANKSCDGVFTPLLKVPEV
jgi:hypothetical protein